MKKIVIFGGCGFIGSHLATALANYGHQVVIVTKTQVPHRFDSNIKFHFFDISRFDNLKKLDDDGDFYINLASSSLPQLSDEKIISNDILIVKSIIKFLQNNSHAHLIHFSSGGLIYGDCSEIATEKSHTKPFDEYSRSKIYNENIILNNNIKSTILRPSNIYGNNFSKINLNGLIQTLIYNIKYNKKTTIWGIGNEKRDYLFIDDLIKLLLIIISSPKVGIYNVSSNISYETKYILDLITEMINPNYDKILYVKNNNIIKNSLISNEKATKEFNWQPVVNINNGIKQVYDYLDVSKN